jgi:hypothetical protein
MANLQNQFSKFNSVIKMGYEESSSLREKRETILNDLKSGLKRLFPSKTPTFSSFHQGSYAIGTGVKPLQGDDFDIDIGIVFNFSKNDYSPTEVKGWVHDALNTLGRTVEYKRPCVRVQYRKNFEKTFHVDLAIYSDPDYEKIWEKNHYIAKGYYGSKEEYKLWEVSEPFALVELFKKRFQNAGDRDQFRRVIRYLKRWKDYNFTSNGYAKPSGIAITALAINHFKPATKYDWQTNSVCYNDIEATNNLVSNILIQFGWGNRISVNLPVKPYNNLFEKMTDNQMSNLKTELTNLRTALTVATNETDTSKACRTLQRVFGNDFPSF